jgi:VWFA-related protein
MKTWRRFSAWCLFCLALITSASNHLAASETTSAPVPDPGNAQTSAGFRSNPNVSTSAQEPGAVPAVDWSRPEGVPAYCKHMSDGKEQAAALDAVCEFALALFWKIPNVFCDEERTRYQEDQLGNEVQRDKITAKVRFEDGREQYSQITINGKPAEAALVGTSGAWSEGEFAEDLRSVFWPQSAAEFKFTKHEVVHGIPALVFSFRVSRRNNRLRYLQGPEGVTTLPGYHGRLWINESTLHLMRLERRVDDVEAGFPIQRADLTIEYGDIDLADGTKFVLPVQSTNMSCPSVASSHCWHSQLTFKHWHKFAARARILAGQEEPAALSPSPATAEQNRNIPPPDVVSVSSLMDLRRGTSIAAEILNDEITQIEPGQTPAVAASRSPIEVDKIPTEIAPQVQPPLPRTPAADTPTEFAGDQVPTFKSSVKLVLVPTVVRDSQNHTVDYLQKADFRLLDDHTPQLITQFSVERPGNLSAASGESAAGVTRQATSTVAMRHAAYVFDDIHAPLDDLVRTREAAKRHLRSLAPGDRAAIFTLSANVMLDFTNDGAKLNDALQRIQPHPLTATGSVRCPDLSYEQADLIQNSNDAIALAAATAEAVGCAFAGDSKAAGPAQQLAKATAAEVLIAARAESQLSFKVLKEIVLGISRVPGQRSIVLVSPGFASAETQPELDEIVNDALKAEVIINVVDPSGLSMSDRAQYGTARGSSDVLVDLSGGTGGTFFHNLNNMDEGFQKTTFPEVFYILGFSPRKLDGRFHKLMVTLGRPEKLSVQARRGYYAAKPGN